MSDLENQPAIVHVKPNSLTKLGIKSLVSRGHVDLRNKDEAEECLKKGRELYERRVDKTALVYFLRGIQLDPNNTELQCRLGWMYNNGEGVTRDNTYALYLYRKAAEHGNVYAQFNLGVMYNKGEGIRQDCAIADSWIRKAAEQGFAHAKFNLAYMRGKGKGLPPGTCLKETLECQRVNYRTNGSPRSD